MTPPFGPFWSAKYLNLTCEIRILFCLTQKTYTLRKLKNQVLLFLSSWEPNLSDCMVPSDRMVYWEKKIFRLSQKERFLEQIEKNPHIFNYWWAGVSNYVYSTILVTTKVYIFLLYFTSDLLLIMRSQPASIEWTVTSTASFSHCWSYTEHSDLWIICVAYIW